MPNYLELPIGPKCPEVVNAVIEIPNEGINKYEYDKELHVFRLDRNLYSPVHYPGDYGFIPSTLSDDGDPLDVLVLGQEQVYPLTIVAARGVGVMRMRDEKGIDDKVICVPLHDPYWNQYEELHELPLILRQEIEQFFTIYKQLEEGKTVTTHGWGPHQEAVSILAAAEARFAGR